VQPKGARSTTSSRIALTREGQPDAGQQIDLFADFNGRGLRGDDMTEFYQARPRTGLKRY
jgi:hypothetical protein